MRSAVASASLAMAIVAQAQPIDLRIGLPSWGLDSMAMHYLADWQGDHLPTIGDQWTWDLDSLNWMFNGEGVDTVWHHSGSIAPKDGGPFSVYDRMFQRFTFFHLNADMLLEDSAWVVSQGTTEIGHPAVPRCWQGQSIGDSLTWHDQQAGVDRITRFRATLTLRTPWGELGDLVVFEDHILDNITYRIHRRTDLATELARYVVRDGVYVRWRMRL